VSEQKRGRGAGKPMPKTAQDVLEELASETGRLSTETIRFTTRTTMAALERRGLIVRVPPSITNEGRLALRARRW
jgi:hypothetical protein